SGAPTMATAPSPVKAPNNRHQRFVQQQISSATRRVRLLDFAAAALGLVIATLVYGLAMGFLDRWLHLPQLGRQVRFVGFLISAGVCAFLVVLRPFRRAVNPYYAAKQVEDTIPDAKNSLVNWLDLHDGDFAPAVKEALDKQAAADLEAADVQQAIR